MCWTCLDTTKDVRGVQKYELVCRVIAMAWDYDGEIVEIESVKHEMRYEMKYKKVAGVRASGER